MFKDYKDTLRDIKSSIQSKICGNCKHHKCEDGEWYCNNLDTDNYAAYTGYDDTCDEWEGK